MTDTSAPIALFVYNRPAHTARTLDALATNALARDSDLIIFADGPKRPEHADAVGEARAVARKASGFRSVRIVEREKNLGLARSIISGVGEVCAEAGRAIVVEDDLIVSPHFLEFLNLGLDRYADDVRVMQISGYAFPEQETAGGYFLPIISCWGWATWSRAWAQFDAAMSGFERIAADANLRKRFNLDDAYDYWGMACNQRSGKVDSWGIRWQMSLFDRQGLVLYPPESLVENTGVDASGTHGLGMAGLQRLLGQSAVRDAWIWPDAVQTDAVRLDDVKRLLRAQQPSAAMASFNRVLRAVVPKAARAAIRSIIKPQ